MILVSESTSGVMHSAEGSTQAIPTQSPDQKERADENKKSIKHAPTLPEDIGKQTAMYLIEEIVKVLTIRFYALIMCTTSFIRCVIFYREAVPVVDVKSFPFFLWLLDKRTFLKYN